jgi:hypothetical protein
MLRVHIAGAFGFPLSYLGEMDSNRATIEGQNDILLKTPARRQKEIGGADRPDHPVHHRADHREKPGAVPGRQAPLPDPGNAGNRGEGHRDGQPDGRGDGPDQRGHGDGHGDGEPSRTASRKLAARSWWPC